MTSQPGNSPYPTRPGNLPPKSALFSVPRHTLARLLLFASLLGLECLLRAILPHSETFLAPLASFAIAAFAVFLGLGYSTLRADRKPLPFHLGYFLAHLSTFALLCLESAAAATGYEPPNLNPALLFLFRAALTIITILLLALALLPRHAWMHLRRATGLLWLYALIAGALTWLLRSPLQSLWTSQNFAPGHWLQNATFACVARLLTPLIPTLEVSAPTYVIRAPNFAIFIAPSCSGLEGLGLVLVFTLAWLLWFRRDFRFPHALLLIPLALVSVWVLNVLRITALMLIGNTVSPEIAITGFHSQAGWIAFTLVALSFSTATRHLRWVQHAPAHVTHHPSAVVTEVSGESPATLPYLIPFLSILAVSFLTRAASGAFEWLYPLRFLVALIAIWTFRRFYRTLDLRFHWTAPLAGAAVFAIWIAVGLSLSPASNPVAAGLSALPAAGRITWLIFRVAAAIFTIPFSEELAFRGFLARRLSARNFDQLPLAQLTILPILISSLAFGLLHGRHWLAGAIAGIVFALLARYRNRLGDAVAAHITLSLLLSIWVLVRGDFSQW